jgi:tetratricopeptide (TPR) repeat protein
LTSAGDKSDNISNGKKLSNTSESEGKSYYYSLVDEYLNSGQTGRALMQAIKNIAYNEDDPAAYINRARVYEKLGDLEGAVRDLQEALRISPSNKDAHEQLERVRKKLDKSPTS